MRQNAPETGQSIRIDTAADTIPPFPVGGESLRCAIQESNAVNSSRSRFTFKIAGSGVHIIKLTSPLPPIDFPIDIDGTTQPGYS